MLNLVYHAMKQWWISLGLAFLVALFGVYAFIKQPIDAYPDISSQVVQIITQYPGRAPEEVERQVTIPIEIAMRNVPNVEVIRSRTIFGLSVVQLVFSEQTESYWARQRVQEKISGINLPNNAKPELGPLATAYGEIFRYELVSDGFHDLMELRTLNDWVVIPRLLRASGVADVSNSGGLEKQFTIRFLPADLERFGLTLSDVVDAVQNNNASGGGSVLQRGSMSFVIRGNGALENLAQIENTFVKSVGGSPVFLRDVARIELDHLTPSGIFSRDDRDDSVEGIVLMRRGENPSKVLIHVEDAISELNSTVLPEGVRIEPFYNRQSLINSTLETVTHSVLLGVTLVVLVLLVFLGRPVMAALVAFTIPFSLLFALVLMYLTKIPIGLLSIGAIDFGIIVDGAIIIAENIARRLGEASRKETKPVVFDVVLKAVKEVERSVFFSIVMIVVAYLPLLSLTSIEGLLFRPMAITMVYALLGAMVFSLFVIPVLATILFRNGYEEWENPLMAFVRPFYSTILSALISCRWLVAGTMICALAFVVVKIVPRLGVEFLPYMDEGVVWVRANFPEGTALSQTSDYGKTIRQIAMEFADIESIAVQAGRTDSGTDPFPPNRLEIMIIPKSQALWSQFKNKKDLLFAIGKRFRDEFPTTRFNFTQPIIDSVTEDTNGTSANLAVEFTGADSGVLINLAQRTVDFLKEVPGAEDVNIEQEGPQPQLVITPDRQLCARHNVLIEEVIKLINTALGGEPIGSIFEGESRFDIAVKLNRKVANSPQAIGRLSVFTPDGIPVPLDQVAKIELVDGQTIIARENGKRRITVRCDIFGRDQGGFVNEVKEKFDREIRPGIPDGYHVEWLGMFANLERARFHFMIVIPVVVILIFGLLVLTFRSVVSAIMLLLSVPFAFIGGVLALWARDMNMNVSTGVGFAALFGVSIMNGVLMVRSISSLRQLGMEMKASILQGALDCLRPILLASLVAILGLLPASLATGLGSDVQRPLATVIVWGLLSSTLLTLFVIPVMYRLFAPGVSVSSVSDSFPDRVAQNEANPPRV